MALVQSLVQLGFTSEQAQHVGDTYADSLSANGTTQGSGTGITSTINRFTTVTAGINDACTLKPLASYGQSRIVIRNDGLGALVIFPASGEKFNSLGANASITLASTLSLIFWKMSDKWITV